MLWTLSLLACVSGGENLKSTSDTSLAEGSASSTTQGTPSGSETSNTTVDPSLEDQLHGVIPSFDLSAPEFLATNRDGGARSRPDLIGHPTVLWFYPLAETPG